MLFVRDMRPHVMRTMPEIAPLDIMKEVGRRWNSISEQDLHKYRSLAVEDLQRYKKEH
jgi:HMG (high mobility group) box